MSKKYSFNSSHVCTGKEAGNSQSLQEVQQLPFQITATCNTKKGSQLKTLKEDTNLQQKT